VACGGYEDDLGWTGEMKIKKLSTHRPTDGEAESYDANRSSFTRSWQTITEHTRRVVHETAGVTDAVALVSDFAAPLHTAALWHDIGKAHDEFQKMLRNGDAAHAGQLWAKSANKDGKCARHGFRHELASALAWLLNGPAAAAERDLVAYLVAAHHGKVRLSIRSLPEETGNPNAPDALYARGVWQGDILPAVSLGEFTTPEITLDLSFMIMGEGKHGKSWLARTVALRDRTDIGPFRLAYLETLLRAADARASGETTT
jgi:CRISPR-associated endonuclease/helicase Cas3